MDRIYWNLFWTTGLPQAWLMSRDRRGPADAAARELPHPLAGYGPQMTDAIPGDPRRIV